MATLMNYGAYVLKKRQMDRVFSKLDVKKSNCKHHEKGYFVFDGKRVATIYYSFGRGEVPAFVTQRIAKAMHLNAAQLLTMARCKISREGYIKILRDKGVL